MIASKVDISEKLKNSKLTRSQKTKLRMKLVKEYINSKPYDTKIPISEFSRILHYNTENEAAPLINKMLELGEISREVVPGYKRGYTYSVCGQVHVTKPKENFKFDVVRVAQEYLWDQNLTHDQNIAVKDFVKHLQQVDKDHFNG